jgi:hypothetical protein
MGKLRALEVGARWWLRAACALPFNRSRRPTADEEGILLAHMIGDGSCVGNPAIRYASIDEQSLLAVADAAEHFGVTAKRPTYLSA